MGKQKDSKKTIGDAAEQAACNFLQAQHLEILETNYRCKLGEIDIIAKESNTIVFIEVRHRKQSTHGNSIDSITHHKLKKMIRTINHYLLTHQSYEKIAHRIDLIGFDQDFKSPEWLKNITI